MLQRLIISDSRVSAPRYRMLPSETDLNMPPRADKLLPDKLLPIDYGVARSSTSTNEETEILLIGDEVIPEGNWLSLNGSTGEVILGKQPLTLPAVSRDLETFMSWADDIQTLKVMANADKPEDAVTARNNGAEGIGLCRT